MDRGEAGEVMSISIIKAEVIEQHPFKQDKFMEQVKAIDGVGYRVKFDYNGHKGVALIGIDKRMAEDKHIDLISFFVDEIREFAKDNPPPKVLQHKY